MLVEAVTLPDADMIGSDLFSAVVTLVEFPVVETTALVVSVETIISELS